MTAHGRAGPPRGSGRRGRAAPARSGLNPAAPRTRTSKSRDTRAAILEAARRLFASRGFEQVSLREIGAEARADPALIARYFGGKERLFAEVLSVSHVPDALLSEGLTGFAQRAARAAVLGEWPSAGLEGLLIALRSASSPEVSDSLIRPFHQRFVQHLADQIGGEEPLARAHLAFACIVGAAFLHGLRPPENLTCSPDQAQTITDRLTRELGELMDSGV